MKKVASIRMTYEALSKLLRAMITGMPADAEISRVVDDGVRGIVTVVFRSTGDKVRPVNEGCETPEYLFITSEDI